MSVSWELASECVLLSLCLFWSPWVTVLWFMESVVVVDETLLSGG